MSDHQSAGAVLDRPQDEREMRRVPLSKIVLREGHNPRETVVRDDEFKALVASVRERGILQPIRVTALENGDFELVAGERRYLAAGEASCLDVPVIIRSAAAREDEEAEALVDALAENELRVGLNPIERARAYERLRQRMTVKGIAQQMGRPQKHVKDTLALLRLPESLQAMVVDGTLPLNTVPTLLELGKMHKQFPELAVAEVLADGDASWGELRDDPAVIIADCAELPDGVYRFSESYPADAFELSEKAKRDLTTILKHTGDSRWYVDFVHADAETAAALNALLRSRDAPWARLIVGADVAAELVAGKLAAYAKELRSAARERSKREQSREQGQGQQQDGDGDARATADHVSPVRDPEAEERQRQQAARKDREREAAERAAAFNHNDKLGAAVMKSLWSVKVDARVLKVLAATPIAHALREVAARGARYGFPGWVTVQQTSGGKDKHKYLDPKGAEAKAIAFLAGAKKPGEVVGRQLALVVMAVFADERCVAPSYRVQWTSTAYDGPWTDEAGELLDALAAEHLPAELVQDKLAARAAAREAARLRVAAQQQVRETLKRIGELTAEDLDELSATIETAWDKWSMERYSAENAVKARRTELARQPLEPEAVDGGPQAAAVDGGQDPESLAAAA